MLASGVQNKDLIFLRIMKGSQQKDQYHLTLYNVVTLSLTIYPVCILHLHAFILQLEIVPFNPLYLFHTFQHIHPSGSHQFILCVYEPISVLFLFYCFQIALISEISFSLYDLFHLTQYPPGLSMLPQMARFHTFYG